MKLYIYINNPDEFLRGDYRWSLHLSDAQPSDFDITNYLFAGEVDVEFDIDNKKVTQYAVDCIDKEEEKTRAEFEVKMGMLKEKKANLLSITHQP